MQMLSRGYLTASSDGSLSYVPDAGTCISEACDDIARLAVEYGKPVHCTFNGVPIKAGPGDSPHTLQQMWEAIMAKQANSWRTSPEGAAAARAEKAAQEKAQKQVDRLMKLLPTVGSNLNALLGWLKEFALAADHIGVTYDREAFVRELVGAGFVADAHVGQPPDNFVTKKMMGEYIVGLAIAQAQKGLPPHSSLVERFVDDYLFGELSLQDEKAVGELAAACRNLIRQGVGGVAWGQACIDAEELLAKLGL